MLNPIQNGPFEKIQEPDMLEIIFSKKKLDLKLAWGQLHSTSHTLTRRERGRERERVSMTMK